MPKLTNFYINLDRSVSRNQHMIEQFASFKIPVTRISAIDGQALETSDTRRMNPEKENYRKLTKGEIACFMSHRKAWQALLDCESTHGIIFEDDIKLSKSAKTLLSDLSSLSEDVGLLKLDNMPFGAMTSNAMSIPGHDYMIKQIQTKAVSSAAYVISREYAQRMLDATPDFSAPVDIVMYDPAYKCFDSFSCWQLFPAIAKQQWAEVGTLFLPESAAKSTIDGRAKPRLHPLGKERLIIELKRPFQQLRRLIERTRLRLAYGATWEQSRFRED